MRTDPPVSQKEVLPASATMLGRVRDLKVWHKFLLLAALFLPWNALAVVIAWDHRGQIDPVWLIASALLAAVACALSLWVVRSITGPLVLTIEAFGKINRGEYASAAGISVRSRDEPGRVLEALKVMAIQLAHEVSEARHQANSALRIQTALDNSTTSVMVSDRANRVFYVNKALMELFTRRLGEIRKTHPDFDPQSLIGRDLEGAFFGHAQDHARLATAAQTERARLAVGPLSFDLIANPVMNDDGQRLGTCVEWSDVTDELAMQEEVKRLIASAVDGDLGKRLSVQGKSGFMEKLSGDLNRLLDTVHGSLADLERVLKALAEGDLGARVDRDFKGLFKDLKDDINLTVARLTEVATKIKESAGMIHTAAGEIASGNTDLSNRTEKQAASLEETASSMEELSTTVKQNAGNAQNASQLAGSARALARQGGEVVSKAVGAMGEISAASTRIADIIGTIDGIAFQTNLLALNAAVEAARAGEQGRGFAVVAAEVRNLASRSALAAKEIKALIADSVEKVKTGAALVDTSGETLAKIVESVNQATDLVTEIATASRQQAAGIEQVTTAIAHMDEITQQNAALVEQAAAASKSMEEQAGALAELVSFFRVGGAPACAVSAGGSMHKIDFAHARQAHLSWLMRLRSFLDEGTGLTLEEAGSHRDCELGRWIYGRGQQQHGSSGNFQNLERKHAQFHDTVREVVAARSRADRKTAEEAFARVKSLSQEVIALIDAVEAATGASRPRADPNAQDKPSPAIHPASMRRAAGSWETF
jgi:methyl-accepting chemotaxis protein